mgnify:CR=1 FL=1
MNTVKVYGAEITYKKEGIIHIHYTSEQMNLDNAKNVIQAIRKDCPWQLAPILVSADPFSEHDDQAQKYLAGEEVMQYCTAIAVIAKNLAQRIGVNFFIRIKKPSKPTRFFTSEKEALKWLGKYETISNSNFRMSS